jgi:hypothetical protein
MASSTARFVSPRDSRGGLWGREPLRVTEKCINTLFSRFMPPSD